MIRANQANLAGNQAKIMNKILGILVILLLLDSAQGVEFSKNKSARSANPCKSFCYFLLSQKVESPILLNFNPPNKADSQDLAQITKSNNKDEFIISYRAIMKNNILIGEEFKVAKALTTSQNPTIIAQCDIIEFSPDDSHIKTLKQNQSAILECIERELKSKIRDDVKSINNEVRTKTTYKIPAQRILLDRQRLKIHIIGQK